MLDALERIEREMPQLLDDVSNWRSLYVDYHPPVVERLWRQHGDFRVYLHRIHPCEPDGALFHPHPWPSAMRLLSGKYEMAIGHGKGDEAPPIDTKRIVSAGACYEMTDPDDWHYVCPIGEPAMTLMVTGNPYGRWAPKSEKPLRELSEVQKREIFDFFTSAYKI